MGTEKRLSNGSENTSRFVSRRVLLVGGLAIAATAGATVVGLGARQTLAQTSDMSADQYVKTPEFARRVDTALRTGEGIRELLPIALKTGARLQELVMAPVNSNDDPRFYFINPSSNNFRRHNPARSPGSDFVTSKEAVTLVTPPAEGRVEHINHVQHSGYYNRQYEVFILHSNRKYSRISHMTSIFVNKGDYVGRHNIIGTGGDVTDTGHGFTSPNHLHLEFQVPLFIWNRMERAESGIPSQNKVMLLDIETQGFSGKRLEVWKGEDFYSEPSSKFNNAVTFANQIYRKTPNAFKDAVEVAVKNGHDRDMQTITQLWESYLNNTKDPSKSQWVAEKLTAKERGMLAEVVNDFAHLTIPLTLPFANVELFKQGIYKIGSSGSKLEELDRNYQAALSQVKR